MRRLRLHGSSERLFFCEHLDDVFWDYTHGPYMFFCEQGEDDMTSKGLLGQCQHFKRGGNRTEHEFNE